MSLKRVVTEENGITVEAVWDGAITTVTVDDGTIQGRGHARWFHTDKYDEGLGYALAYRRALYRWAKRGEDKLIRSLGV